jgi:hypothetical protein
MTQLFLPGFEPALPHPARLPRAAPRCPPLANYPHVSGRLRSVEAKRIGRAGEALVDSTLQRYGFECFEAPEDAPFDRIVGLRDAHEEFRLLGTMQVKTTTEAADGFYRFRMSCGFHRSPQGRRSYGAEAFNIAALVILPHNAVFFTAEKAEMHRIAVPELAGLIARPQASLLAALGLPALRSPLEPDVGPGL